MNIPDIIIAIDGYSSTGKSSFAKIIANEFSFLYLDSGALYRGVTLFAIENGFIKVPEKPGLGFDELNEEVLRAHINPNIPGYFEPTEEWNKEFANDRIWS